MQSQVWQQVQKTSHCLKNVCAPINSVRFVSGYKLNVENYEKLRKTRKENVTSEFEKFREKVDLSVIQKARPKVFGFDVITHVEIKNKTGESYNAKFENNESIPPYRSYIKYYHRAEAARKEIDNKETWWQTYQKAQRSYEPKIEFEDIGIPTNKKSNGFSRDLETYERNEIELERLARTQQLLIDCEKVIEDWETSFKGKEQIKNLMHHFNIFQDLFKDKDFYPNVHMEVDYPDKDDEDLLNPVYYGNKLTPTATNTEPLISYESSADDLWTILLTNPDGNLVDNDKEYLHWMVGNIKGNDLSTGETIMNYLQPFPVDGTGYHRMVFLLFKQKQKIDFSKSKRSLPCTSLTDRDFVTREFYDEHCNDLTPASLRFFQTKWDFSVKDVFHNTLDMKEPIYKIAEAFEIPRVQKPYPYPEGLPLEYLDNFLPAEPLIPDGSNEATEVLRGAALKAAKVL